MSYTDGYASPLYEKAEDWADYAYRQPSGPQRDFAIKQYMNALFAVTDARTEHQKQLAKEAAEAEPKRWGRGLSRLPGRTGEYAWKISA